MFLSSPLRYLIRSFTHTVATNRTASASVPQTLPGGTNRGATRHLPRAAVTRARVVVVIRAAAAEVEVVVAARSDIESCVRSLRHMHVARERCESEWQRGSLPKEDWMWLLDPWLV
jgi:hypothetical protein